MTNREPPLETIGLGGDGDELDAVVAVEKYFGIPLDYREVSNWVTVGDLFGSVLKTLPPDRSSGDDPWPAFTNILCDETGADPKRVAPQTLLLARPLRTVVGSWLGRPSDTSD